MADDIAISAGTGTSVATDEIGGRHFQRIKVTIGADGTAVDASAGAGAVGTGVQRTTLASDDPAVTSLAVIDDWDESDRAKVNLIVGQAGIAAGAGAVGATVPRVTHASDDPVVTQIGGLTETAPASDTASSGLNGRLQRVAQRLTSLLTGIVLASGTAIIGKVGVDQTTDGTTNKVNIDASLKSGTATRSTVNSGTSSVTILASNANRKGAVIYNSDANALHLDLSGGTAVVATRCQVILTIGQTYEIPAGSTTAITGIWAADGSGIADVVEYT